MPTADHLQLDQTFESKRDLVNSTIVLTVIEALDLVTYPVAETIIYDMIHNRHKHRREEHLIKQRSVSFHDTQNRRKHMNSRRNDVSILFCFFIIFSLFLLYTTSISPLLRTGYYLLWYTFHYLTLPVLS